MSVSEEILDAADQALRVRDFAAVQKLAAGALPGDYLVPVLRRLYGKHPVTEARMLVTLLAVRAAGQNSASAARPAPALARAESEASARRPTVVLVGGQGNMVTAYNRAAADYGYELRYVENGKAAFGTLRPAAVFVVCTRCSHPLAEAAARLAENAGVRVTYLMGPSVQQLRLALEQLK
mgnify:CR=1 FL=1